MQFDIYLRKYKTKKKISTETIIEAITFSMNSFRVFSWKWKYIKPAQQLTYNLRKKLQCIEKKIFGFDSRMQYNKILQFIGATFYIPSCDYSIY